MNDPTLIGPCADYEHDLVELHDGALPPERASAVRLHVAQCVRCRDWAQAFASLDAGLAAAMPRVELSADFEERLQHRLAALSRAPARGNPPGALELEHEHDALLAALRRGARRKALLGAIGSAAAAACVLIAARDLLLDMSVALGTVPGGTEPWMLFGAVGVAVAIAGLAWSSFRGALPLPGLAR